MKANRALFGHLPHSILSGDAHWSVSGYYQEFRTKTSVKGFLNVKSDQTQHLLTTTLFNEGNQALLLQRNSQISIQSQTRNTWQDSFGSYGVLTGVFSIIDETLLVNLRSRQNNFQSIESILRVFEDEYEIRGVLYQGNKQLIIWRLELIRLPFTG